MEVTPLPNGKIQLVVDVLEYAEILKCVEGVRKRREYQLKRYHERVKGQEKQKTGPKPSSKPKVIDLLMTTLTGQTIPPIPPVPELVRPIKVE